MLLLGIDLGTSSIKVSVVDAHTQQCIASTSYPEEEVDIIAPQPGWAEQRPDLWWEHVQQAILKCNASGKYNPKDIGAIGLSYQMHGLVLVDKEQIVLRNAIIWCDGRAVEIGNKAFADIGEEKCLAHLLNSPGNFTAAKLAWVKNNEPGIYDRIDKILLPGDFIAMRLTGETTTTSSALSEGIFWDFATNQLSTPVLNYFGFSSALVPQVQPVFSCHGRVTKLVADALSLTAGIPVTYKAGDQLNNAFSLNVLQPGEVAATAGTSGVIYGVSDNLSYDTASRINSFAHVNHHDMLSNGSMKVSESTSPSPLEMVSGGEVGGEVRIGILLCINGAGIFNRWIKNIVAPQNSYNELNALAAKIDVGANGLMMLPFGNGAERMLDNKIIGAHIHHADFNRHTPAHFVRAAQESIAFAFRYGLDIMRENDMYPSIIRAGKSNMFLSDVFVDAFVNATGVPVELYENDGSAGAALGAGVGVGHYKNYNEAFTNRKPLKLIEPSNTKLYEQLYQQWKNLLQIQMHNIKPVTKQL